MEEFLVGFLIEEDIFFCMPFEIEESTSYVEALDSPQRMDVMRDELDSMARNKV